MSKLPSIEFLEKKNVSFKVIELPRPPKSAQDVMLLFQCQLAQVIKTLLFVGDMNILACLPGDRNADLALLRKLFKISNLRLATPSEIKTVTGFEVGSVCPFLFTDKVHLVLDEACLLNEKINVGAGTRTTGIELKSADLKKVWPGQIARISNQ